MEIIRDPKQLKPAPAGGGVGQPPSPPNRPFAPGDPLDDGDGIWRIGRNDHFGAGLYHAGNNRVVGQRGEYYDHTPRPLGVQELAREFSGQFETGPKRGKTIKSKTKKVMPPLKEGPPKPPAKKKV